jgi:hypothetical protein
MDSGRANRTRASTDTDGTPAAGAAAARWALGSDHVQCIKADACVIFPALPTNRMFVATPPMFTCAEHVASSSIEGHGIGLQREVHVLSRLQSLDFAAEAKRFDAFEAPFDSKLVDSTAYKAMGHQSDSSSRDTVAGESDGGPWRDAAATVIVRSVTAASRVAFGVSSVCWVGGIAGASRHQDVGNHVPRLDRSDHALSHDRIEQVFVLRRPGESSRVVRLTSGDADDSSHRVDTNGLGGSNSDGGRGNVAAKAGHVLLLVENERLERAGRWYLSGRTLLLQWNHATLGRGALTEVLCLEDLADGSFRCVTRLLHTLRSSATRPHRCASATCRRYRSASLQDSGNRSFRGVRGHAQRQLTTLVPLVPTVHAGTMSQASAAEIRFWIHDESALWWRPYLQCTPDWDSGMDSQNAAEVWILSQLMQHPWRTSR